MADAVPGPSENMSWIATLAKEVQHPDLALSWKSTSSAHRHSNLRSREKGNRVRIPSMVREEDWTMLLVNSSVVLNFVWSWDSLFGLRTAGDLSLKITQFKHPYDGNTCFKN